MKDILTHLAISNIDIVDPTNKNLINSSTATDAQKNALTENVITILNAIIGVLGLLAVVIIILGGVQYMTSSGDAGKVKKAKDTILYGIIGLVIVALAFAIVNFVIGNILAQS